MHDKKAHAGALTQLHSFSACIANGSERSDSPRDHFTSWESPRYTFGRKMGRPQSLPRAIVGEEYLLHLPGIFHDFPVGSSNLYWPC